MRRVRRVRSFCGARPAKKIGRPPPVFYRHSPELTQFLLRMAWASVAKTPFVPSASAPVFNPVFKSNISQNSDKSSVKSADKTTDYSETYLHKLSEAAMRRVFTNLPLSCEEDFATMTPWRILYAHNPDLFHMTCWAHQNSPTDILHISVSVDTPWDYTLKFHINGYLNNGFVIDNITRLHHGNPIVMATARKTTSA